MPALSVDVITDEPSPHEPDDDHEPEPPEFDTEIPDVEPDVDGFLGPSDVPTELLTAFWSLVVLFNVGLLATSLGAMLVWFRGDLTYGGGLLAVGLLALAHGSYKYLSTDPDRLGGGDGSASDGDREQDRSRGGP